MRFVGEHLMEPANASSRGEDYPHDADRHARQQTGSGQVAAGNLQIAGLGNVHSSLDLG